MGREEIRGRGRERVCACSGSFFLGIAVKNQQRGVWGRRRRHGDNSPCLDSNGEGRNLGQGPGTRLCVLGVVFFGHCSKEPTARGLGKTTTARGQFPRPLAVGYLLK